VRRLRTVSGILRPQISEFSKSHVLFTHARVPTVSSNKNSGFRQWDWKAFGKSACGWSGRQAVDTYVCINSATERSLEKVRLFRSGVAPVSDQKVSLLQSFLQQRSEGFFSICYCHEKVVSQQCCPQRQVWLLRKQHVWSDCSHQWHCVFVVARILQVTFRYRRWDPPLLRVGGSHESHP